MTFMKSAVQLLVIVAVVLAAMFIATSNAGAQELDAYAPVYKYNVLWITSWEQWHPDPYEPSGNIGIMLASEQCPDGAVEINFEVWPNYYMDEYTDWCEGGIDMIGVDAINLMGDILEMRLQHGIVMLDPYEITGEMTKDEFWDEVFETSADIRDVVMNGNGNPAPDEEAKQEFTVVMPVIIKSGTWSIIGPPPVPTPESESLPVIKVDRRRNVNQ